ncbi:MAG: glutathione-dependent disulfide-bond oxidoreductase [Phenylobacterium sp.]|uniref:glutathione-dependent disulfide-bond oxidoreductase n=1 Tax=Phenylobacterium sp. TaxID=1871053 RepID=UPI0011F52417|nr:glutathione-dependent disulfide-bond oxidoreductase [Phenylobacterium sp.]TAJ71862.1 MAG: glutathione-dependent disulfide-bond oxidoreductase [Phenylobacterium sp.]
MSDGSDYTPPKVWRWERQNGGRFASINRPLAGSTHEQALPLGTHPFQLYSRGTPNGIKVTVLFEELLALGKPAEYDAWMIDIGQGEQFGSGFVDLNPNSKIPALLDRSDPARPIRVFESGSILLHLAERFDAFLPAYQPMRAETLSWLMWQMGATPYLGGGFGHFYAYAPTKIEYAIDRFAMEVKRQLDVLDRRLAESEYLAGDEYTIADIAVWPWHGLLTTDGGYDSYVFLDVESYKHVRRWTHQIAGRPAVRRGRVVNKDLAERHAAGDIDALLCG